MIDDNTRLKWLKLEEWKRLKGKLKGSDGSLQSQNIAHGGEGEKHAGRAERERDREDLSFKVVQGDDMNQEEVSSNTEWLMSVVWKEKVKPLTQPLTIYQFHSLYSPLSLDCLSS